MKHYTLALAVWLAFSAPCHAITFSFEVTGGDTDQVEFNARLGLDAAGPFGGTGNVDSGGTTNISSGGAFEFLSMSYAFFGGQASFFLSSSGFIIANSNQDQVTIESGAFGDRLVHATVDISAIGFAPNGFFSPFDIEFGIDNSGSPRPVITGLFVQQVPEPAILSLLAFGLCLIGFKASQRSASLRPSPWRPGPSA